MCAKWTGRVRRRREGAAEELGAARDKCFSPLSPPYTRRGGKGGFISFFFCLLLFPFSCLLRKKCLYSYPPCVFCKKKNKKPCTDAHDTMDITLTCLSWLASSFSDSICHATNNRKHEAKMKAASYFNRDDFVEVTCFGKLGGGRAFPSSCERREGPVAYFTYFRQTVFQRSLLSPTLLYFITHAF